MSKLTEEQALIQTIKLWEMIAATGEDKLTVAEGMGISEYENICPLCEYVKQQDKDACGDNQETACKQHCPVSWPDPTTTLPRIVPCEYSTDSPWKKYRVTLSSVTKKTAALEMVMLAKRALAKLQTKEKTMKYDTKDTDYTGCDPVIAEHLKQDKAILCEVWDNPDDVSREKYVYAYDVKSPFPYRIKSMGYKYATPIVKKKTVTMVKSAPEIMEELIRHDYEVNENGNWKSKSGFGSNFTPEMWQYCGTCKLCTYTWNDEWLTEKSE